MTITARGKLPVVTPGTAVPLTTDAKLTAHTIVVSQVPGTTGTVYLKNIKSGTAVIARAFLPAGGSAFLDEHRIEGGDLINPLRPADWAVDADNPTEGLNVYWATL
jgi:hypothetical protein